MKKTAKSRAEEQFAKTRSNEQSRRALKDREKAENDRAAQVARLRALRLAKEADDKAAAAAAPAKPTRSSKTQDAPAAEK